MIKLETKDTYIYFLYLLFIDLIYILDIPYLRQIFWFISLTFLPGFLLIRLIKIEISDYTTCFLLSIGISISFNLLFSFSLNYFILNLGYDKPLSAYYFIIFFNIIIISLIFILHFIKNRFVLPEINLNFNSDQKAFLIPAIMFLPASLIGGYLLNSHQDNRVIIALLISIALYLTLIYRYEFRFPKLIYPLAIIQIGLSLPMIYIARCYHIIGTDRHLEYALFLTVLHNHEWAIYSNSNLDSCLTITLIPVLYQQLMDINPETLYMFLLPIFAVCTPLIIYKITLKYLSEFYSFIAAIFFIFQSAYILDPGGRTKIALLFMSLAFFVFFDNNISKSKSKSLFILFSISCILSHYASAYQLIMILIASSILLFGLKFKINIVNRFNPNLILLLFCVLFAWYALITQAPFNSALDFASNVFGGILQTALQESKGGEVSQLLGKDLLLKSIPQKIEFILSWLIFLNIGIGIIMLIKNYKTMVSLNSSSEKMPIIKTKFDIEYISLSLMSSLLLSLMLILPYASKGYDIGRTYYLAIIILAPFFILGSLFLYKMIFLKLDYSTRYSSLVLFILIGYFFSITGMTYELFGDNRSIILNSEGSQYDILYIHDQEVSSSKWLNKNYNNNKKIFTDARGIYPLISQGEISINSIDKQSLFRGAGKKGYIYFRYLTVTKGILLDINLTEQNLKTLKMILKRKSKIYNNAGAEIYD